MPDGGCHETEEWVDGIVTDSCPVMYIAEYGILFRTVNLMEHNMLPYDGSWMRQPAALMERVDIVTSEMYSRQEEKRREQEREIRTRMAQSTEEVQVP